MAGSQNYIALSRKYRPQNLNDIVGQTTLVRILKNAISQDRLGHAFLFHGIRGTGKTTTARLLARCLNCIGIDGHGSMTVDPCGECDHCLRIGTDSHIDVIEMDAASHTGVDDIREIIESSRYKPVAARFKVFIIDEVHMLSKSAFNALLKTLEEPPPHVKFILATTELHKVPETVLSRCMRFDLERISPAFLKEHYQKIVGLEGYTIDEEALNIIARVAEGSARDGISILDQAINTSEAKHISTQHVQKMLGLLSQQDAWALLLAILKGEANASLSVLDSFYVGGGDPLRLLESLMDNVHLLSTIVVTEGTPLDTMIELSADLKNTLLALWPQLGVDQLHRLWTLLIKGFEEVRQSPLPLASARMVLLKLSYVADLPTPREVLEKGLQNETVQPTPAHSSQPVAASIPQTNQPSLAAKPEKSDLFKGEGWEFFHNVCQFVKAQREALVYSMLENHVEFIEGHPGFLKMNTDTHVPEGFAKKLKQILDQSGIAWNVEASMQHVQHTLAHQMQQEQDKVKEKVSQSPLIRDVLETFPGAVITNITKVS